jgi:hypothetical protein
MLIKCDLLVKVIFQRNSRELVAMGHEIVDDAKYTLPRELQLLERE